ncbi:MAG TPA: TlpA disulfide reductase family protein [Saprospiraceae bacterium]|nr:TlpA disulfide reductase family protein [Saprospiraceae bacterium]HPN69596.1 TlpA disulfide reductase family protein [Saprospiraceae bacterium]
MISKLLNIALIILIAGLIGNYIYKLPKFSKGNEVPAPSIIFKDGTHFNIDSINNKYILLHFWGSWCATCRRKNPELVSMYKTYLDENTIDPKFMILSIALEKNLDQYEAAVGMDSIFWDTQIVEKELFKSEIAKLYGIREIPTTYLIGPDKKVLMINPKISKLKHFVQNIDSTSQQGQID